MTEICKVCGMRHSDTYEKDAKILLNALKFADMSTGKVEFTLLGGAVNDIGATILIKHALKILEES